MRVTVMRPRPRRFRAALTALAVGGLLAAAGCAGPSSSGSTGSRSPSGGPSASAAPGSGGGKAAPVPNRAAAFRKWGIPLLPPPPAPPAVKPVHTGGPQIPVVSRIPTQQKIVFVTFDDGAEKDPKFVDMMRDLRIPFTMFLTDAIIKNDYGYFRPLQALGNSIEDHTLTHPDLRTRSLAQQRSEICGQQTRLTGEYGTRPGLFRPPYGAYDAATRTAAQSCGGLRAIILWRESMQIKKVAFQDPGKRFHPGDIILAHFRGPSELKGETMTVMVRNMLREIARQGYTVARLEDYV
ncbi:polysaccharide deacetylase family protein [Actinacidiphila rubida]|uniref:Peptidoglycan/xylan/chitin deacetylase, PgdA/CDA1 family n=1 Tax=Actinacidiphila rubida TaxID=310780 RepID=A0A1H8MIY7_9ACTN|nr:polysaccharide deacetylase family protein [Actinacidiphila rubida]SEO17381.1 Peptidoglycan/xylan/chitin deacetylase, PgdA/CDA1 family [Actinacidiphila rubida]